MSRQLVMVACAWLLLSWALNLWIDPPLMPVMARDPGLEFAQRITPAIRGMLVSILLGLGLMWPSLRLSQLRADGVELGCDLATLLLLVQIVLWPMRVLVGWSLGRTLAIDLAIAETAAAAGVLAWAGQRGGTTGSRAAATAGCALLLVGGLLGGAMLNEPGWAAWSPLRIVWDLSDVRGPLSGAGVAWMAGAAGLVIAAAWLALLRSGMQTRPEDADTMDLMKPDRASPPTPGRDGDR